MTKFWQSVKTLGSDEKFYNRVHVFLLTSMLLLIGACTLLYNIIVNPDGKLLLRTTLIFTVSTLILSIVGNILEKKEVTWNRNVVEWIATCEIIAFAASFFNFADKEFYIMWLAVVPIVFEVLLGIKKGLIATGSIWVFTIMAFFTPLRKYSLLDNSSPDFYKFASIFAIVLALSTLVGTILAQFLNNYTKSIKTLSGYYHKAMNTDALTGLNNQTHFINYITNTSNSLEAGDRIGLMFIDVDNFKGVNDTYGHLIGNEVLVGIANALNSEPHDLLVRWGGDEFIIIEKDVTKKDLVNMAKRIKKRVESISVEQHKELRVTISIGITYYTVDEHLSFDELMNKADIQLAVSKKSGKNTISIQEAN